MTEKRKKLILAVAVIFAVNIFIIAMAQRASADLYKKGASGDMVVEIQTRLKNWGYYDGAVDGIFGSGTERAVKYFQRTNGLSADGQVGDLTLAALGITPTGSSGGGSSGGGSEDVDLLARLISAEARGEPYEGQVAVGAVVLNRVKHASFPNSISGVIYQSGAFSCLYDGQFDERLPRGARRAERLGPELWRYILFQSRHRDKQMDMVAAAYRRNRQAQVLRITVEIPLNLGYNI